MPIETPSAQYRQLAALLRQDIESGKLPAGSLLPPEPELAATYGVSRTTVNSAVAILRAEGLVRVLRGRGTMVRRIPPVHRNAPARYTRAAREREGGRGAFDTEIREMGLTPRSVTTVELVTPPADVARALGLPEGQPNTIRRMRYMYADDVPVQIAPSYIPADIAGGTQLAEVDSGPGGVISRFAELGHAQVRITESVRARPATDAERSFLELDAEQPVLEIWHTGWTEDGRAVEVAVHAVPSSGWILDYEWPVS